MFKKTTLSLAAAIAAFAPIAAHAEISENITITVSIDDLDLSSVKDQSRLESSIKTATREICAAGNPRLSAELAAEKRCVEQVNTSVRGQIDLAISKTAPRHAANTKVAASPAV